MNTKSRGCYETCRRDTYRNSRGTEEAAAENAAGPDEARAEHPIVVGATGATVGTAISAVVTLRRTPEAGMVETNSECYQICLIDNGTTRGQWSGSWKGACSGLKSTSRMNVAFVTSFIPHISSYPTIETINEPSP